jgi:membrane associated rhomboid family serine protease
VAFNPAEGDSNPPSRPRTAASVRRDFQTLLTAAKQIGPATALLAATLIVVFVVEELQTPIPDFIAAGHPVAFPPALVLNFGLIPESVRSGEWWLLITSGFVHADLLNLASNVIGLLIVGAMFERSFGPVRFLSFFLVSVVGGNLLVIASATHFVLVSGASGGILGLTSAGVVAGLRYQSLAIRGVYALILIALALANGFSTPQVSWAGHIGGLATGAIGGLLFGVSSQSRRDEADMIRASQAAEAASLAKGQPDPHVTDDLGNQLTLPYPGGRSLELTPTGFVIHHREPAREILWREVTGFTAVGNSVEYRYTPAYIARQRSPLKRIALVFPHGLRVTTMPGAQLAALLESWRNRWT